MGGWGDGGGLWKDSVFLAEEGPRSWGSSLDACGVRELCSQAQFTPSLLRCSDTPPPCTCTRRSARTGIFSEGMGGGGEERERMRAVGWKEREEGKERGR